MSVKNNNQLNRFDLLYIKNKEPQTYEDVVYYVKKKKEPKKYLQMYKEQKDIMKNKDKKKISWKDITKQNYKHFLLDNPKECRNEYEKNNILFTEEIENLDSEEEELLQHLIHNNKSNDDIDVDHINVKEQKVNEIKIKEFNKGVNKNKKINVCSKIVSDYKKQVVSKDIKTNNNKSVNENELEKGNISNVVVTHKKVRDNTIRRNDYYNRKFEERHKTVESAQQKKVINVIQKLEKKRIKLNL